MTPGRPLPRASARDPGGRAGHPIRGRATGPARAVPSRTGSGHARCPAHSPVAPVPGRTRPVACTRARGLARTPGRPVARIRARGLARTPVRAAVAAPARTRCLVAHHGRRRSMAPGRGKKAIPGGQHIRPPVSARIRTAFPVSARLTVTARLSVAIGLTTPTLGRRRMAAAAAAAAPGRDGNRPNLERTRRAGALTRPAVGGGARPGHGSGCWPGRPGWP